MSTTQKDENEICLTVHNVVIIFDLCSSKFTVEYQIFRAKTWNKTCLYRNKCVTLQFKTKY